MLPLLFAIALALPAWPSPAFQAPPAGTRSEAKIAWSEQPLDAALADARAKGKRVLAWFATSYDSGSLRMKKEGFADARVAELLADTLCVLVSCDRQNPAADRWRVTAPPVLIWFNPDGTVRERIDGYLSTTDLQSNVARVAANIGTLDDLRAKIVANERDFDARWELHQRLEKIGDPAGAAEQKAAILRLDTERRSLGARRFRYQEITGAIERHWGETQQLDVAKIDELKAFVEVETDPWILWDGWMRLSNTHDYWAQLATQQGRPEEAREHRSKRRAYLARGWIGVPEDRERTDGPTFVDLYWRQRDELSADDKAFLVRMAERMVRFGEREGRWHELLSRALEVAGRPDEARAAARRAVELEPTKPEFQQRVRELEGG